MERCFSKVHVMAEVIIIEVDCAPALYPRVNAILGLDPNTGAGDWPKGLLTHIGSGGDGTVVVVEVWESRADQRHDGCHLGSVRRLWRLAWLSRSAQSG